MNRFSKTSRARLDSCHEDLQRICEKVLEVMDITVIQGHRSEKEQNEAYKAGKSKLKYPESKHNSDPSRAVDIAPWVGGQIPWKNEKYFYFMAGIMFAIAEDLGIDIRWGGDWNSNGNFDDQSFDDLVHFELVD